MTTQEILEAARGAKTAVALSDSGTRDSALLGMADALCAPESMDAILAANAEDMAAAKGRISDVMLDRLALTPQRIEAMAKGIRDVAALPDPVVKYLLHIYPLSLRVTIVPRFFYNCRILLITLYYTNMEISRNTKNFNLFLTL